MHYSFQQKIVDGNENENTTGKTHSDFINPVDYTALAVASISIPIPTPMGSKLQRKNHMMHMRGGASWEVCTIGLSPSQLQ
jgi:hypothetical protein